MNAIVTTLLAHQGGWDEALLIGGPMAVIAGLLVIAKKRVDSAAAEQQPTARDTTDGGPDGSARHLQP